MAGSNEHAMHFLKTTLLLSSLLIGPLVHAQGKLQITNITVTDEGVETIGLDVTALITSSPAKGRVLLYDKDGVQIGAWVRTNTHHVSGSASGKDNAGIVVVLDLVANLQRDKREVGRSFLPDEERVVRIVEKFTVQTGKSKRQITVSFDGKIE
jgi:hypothetical protein